MSDYKINPTVRPDDDKCANPSCEHRRAAHGSNGRICCACRCTNFIEKDGTDVATVGERGAGVVDRAGVVD